MKVKSTSALAPRLPESVPLCSGCHQGNSAMPEGFPQVDATEHSGGLDCAACHDPHRPGMQM